MDAELAAWLDAVSEEWNLSRSCLVEIAVRTIQEVLGTRIRLTESDQTRAHHAFECFNVGEIPSQPDLEAFVRWWTEHREVGD